ncbi:MAG: TrkH family potassium uptake protein [Planctomycetota bacterium]|nr:TrkH family potassium uptake protein [Planctomycetota bacterium]
MNLRVVSKLLGIVAMLIGGMMVFSLPWAHPALGHRNADNIVGFLEVRGFVSLLLSMMLSFLVGWLLIRYGRGTEIRLYRKEAMAIVGLSWILATVLGALPFLLRGTYRGPSVRLAADNQTWQVYDSDNFLWRHWDRKGELPAEKHEVVLALYEALAKGLELDQLVEASSVDNPQDLLADLRNVDGDWRGAIIFPDEEDAPDNRRNHYRLRWIKMGIADALFESQSGFSTTGATVLSDLEDPVLVPHCLLFWRSSTHFLGGLGIIVLFVAILGQGSAGKALMRAEMPGPSKEGMQARMQQTAWAFAGIYCVLNAVLTLILWLQGLSLFDALCHAFGTMATGGFSTWNTSLGHFDSAWIDYTVTLFMIIAGTNFTLLYFVALRQPKRLFDDIEWRAYLGVILGVTLFIVVTGLRHGDFEGASFGERLSHAVRYGLFQVVSIVTTTGYGTHDFDRWSSVGRGVLFLLMFVGGCAGSTGGGLKVIRHILFLKIMALETEQAFHPTVVRPLRLGGKSVEDPDLRKNILVYFGLILVIFVFSWMFVVAVEPDATWGTSIEHKLIDSASGVAATLNNIGPGLGTVGATQNYGHFSSLTKFLFVWLMMIGRIEIFAILVLFMPSFWRNR